MKSLTREFSNDLCKIQNLVHSLKILNDKTMQGIEDLNYIDLDENGRQVILNEIANNHFATETILNIIDEIRFSSKMTDYENAIFSAENKHSTID